MADLLLDEPAVYAVLGQVGHVGVAQRVRRQRFGQIAAEVDEIQLRPLGAAQPSVIDDLKSRPQMHDAGHQLQTRRPNQPSGLANRNRLKVESCIRRDIDATAAGQHASRGGISGELPRQPRALNANHSQTTAGRLVAVARHETWEESICDRQEVDQACRLGACGDGARA
jgi:hypothetical protein